MKILIEGYRYTSEKAEAAVKGLDLNKTLDGQVSFDYVGYFYNPHIKDCVFILPKVLVDEHDKVFEAFKPEQIIDMEGLSESQNRFIFGFAVWIYRVLKVFNDSHETNDIIYSQQVTEVGSKGRRAKSNTLLDVLLALEKFNREHQDFFTFVLKNIHSGFNKINWTKTISKSQAFIQDDAPVYLKVMNRKRMVNFDEELLVIFFSILNYMNETYGFRNDLNFGFELITGTKFRRYLNGFGKRRLRQIKYKYFSDLALRLWDLCYAFFDYQYKIQIDADQKEYMLAKDFNIIFEAIIDDLIGDSEDDMPEGIKNLKEQRDGKRLDHIYKYTSLTNASAEQQTYYIGDSKYYKIGAPITDESVYKQFTYAKNLIQWNLDLFNRGESDKAGVPKYRDDVTEGYNIVPNFFISAMMAFGEAKSPSYEDTFAKSGHIGEPHTLRQFENRLFDRDTLLVCHYDVNFLYVVKLYARQNSSEKRDWKEKVRAEFRRAIQTELQAKFDFYAMAAHNNVNAEAYLKEHFKTILGKVFQPFTDKRYFSLALSSDPKEKDENDVLLAELSKHFHIGKCDLGVNPDDVKELQTKIAEDKTKSWRTLPAKRDGVLMVMMEDFERKSIGFLGDGKIAIALKDTPDGNELLANISNLQYAFFHVRNPRKEKQHLFRITSEVMVADAGACGSIYKNVSTATRYLLVCFDSNFEMISDTLDATKKGFIPATRYDAQYATLDLLRS